MTTNPPVILVVEDDPFLRMVAVDLLMEAGFDTLEAPDAGFAIGILEKRADITFVFTDIDMPGEMDGLKLAACIRDRWPPIHIVITSGHKSPQISDLPLGSRFIAKPYNVDHVTSTLRDMAA